jgi:F-type H+-transporting ATPase subunit epsilon
MKLRLTTPTEVVLDMDAVHVTVEDPTGSLGLRPGHAPLVTALVPGILVVRGAGGSERYAAVNGGVLVADGETVEVVSRQAVSGTDIAHLDGTVVAGFEKDVEGDRANHAAFEKMRIRFMKGMLEFDRADA